MKEYNTSGLYDDIHFSGLEKILSMKMNLIFPTTVQVTFHGKCKTRKLNVLLRAKYRIVLQCQNIIK